MLHANSGEFITHTKAKMLIASHKISDETELWNNSAAETPKTSSAKPVNLNFTLLPSEQQRVCNTLKTIKNQQGFQTDAEALMYLIDYFWQTYNQ